LKKNNIKNPFFFYATAQRSQINWIKKGNIIAKNLALIQISGKEIEEFEITLLQHQNSEYHGANFN
jgi:hypothetical protein